MSRPWQRTADFIVGHAAAQIKAVLMRRQARDQLHEHIAATVVSDDPILGLYAYCGELTRHGASIEVIPRDGLRDGFGVVLENTRFQMRLDRHGFDAGKTIAFSEAPDHATFSIENRSHDQQTMLTLKGLPSGQLWRNVCWEASAERRSQGR